RRGHRVDSFRGAHRGYERLASPVCHSRAFCLDTCVARLLVHDLLDGSGEHSLVWRFHLDPAVSARIDAEDVRLTCGDGEVWLLPDAPHGLMLSLQPGWVSPSYGVRLPTTVVVWETTARLPLVASFLFAE